eukprot:237372_1
MAHIVWIVTVAFAYMVYIIIKDSLVMMEDDEADEEIELSFMDGGNPDLADLDPGKKWNMTSIIEGIGVGILYVFPLIAAPLYFVLYQLYLYALSNGSKYEKAAASFIERPFYNYLYQYQLRAVSDLNSKYNNVNCRVCLHQFGTSAQKKDILHCGHRFHRKCFRAWELQQLHVLLLQHIWFKAYQCPMCRTEYNWRQKWDDTIVAE